MNFITVTQGFYQVDPSIHHRFPLDVKKAGAEIEIFRRKAFKPKPVSFDTTTLQGPLENEMGNNEFSSIYPEVLALWNHQYPLILGQKLANS
jgi:hypothetical protein